MNRWYLWFDRICQIDFFFYSPEYPFQPSAGEFFFLLYVKATVHNTFPHTRLRNFNDSEFERLAPKANVLNTFRSFGTSVFLASQENLQEKAIKIDGKVEGK